MTANLDWVDKPLLNPNELGRADLVLDTIGIGEPTDAESSYRPRSYGDGVSLRRDYIPHAHPYAQVNPMKPTAGRSPHGSFPTYSPRPRS